MHAEVFGKDLDRSLTGKKRVTDKSQEGHNHAAQSSYKVIQENKKQSKGRPNFAQPTQEPSLGFANFFFLWLGRFFLSNSCEAFQHWKYSMQMQKHSGVQTPFKFPCLVPVYWMHPKNHSRKHWPRIKPQQTRNVYFITNIPSNPTMDVTHEVAQSLYYLT